MSWRDDLRETAEDRRLVERERVCFEATENLARAMEAASTTKAELARRLGTSKSWVTQLLSGSRNLTLGTLSDAFHVLDRSMHVTYGPPTDAIQVVDDDEMWELGELGASRWEGASSDSVPSWAAAHYFVNDLAMGRRTGSIGDHSAAG